MKTSLATITFFFTLLFLSFFTVFAFHAQTPLQEEVKTYLETGQEELPFSESANSHMQDVFKLLTGVRIITTLLIIATGFLLSHITKRSLQTVAITLVTLPVLLALIPWNTVFTLFHQVFFPQGNWMFPASSLLIQTYPAKFFISYTIQWSVLVLLIATVLYVLSQKLPASGFRQEV